MTTHGRFRRIGWLAALGACTALYLMLHLKVHAVLSEIVRAERQIVALEQDKLLLETEFESRSNQLQLAAWNRVDFGYTAPTAEQFLENERQLASFGGPPAPGSPAPIRVAGVGAAGGDEPEFPRLVSPLTGKPLDHALLDPEGGPKLARAGLADGAMRIPLRAVIASAAQ
jgi:hypothetical protein